MEEAAGQVTTGHRSQSRQMKRMGSPSSLGWHAPMTESVPRRAFVAVAMAASIALAAATLLVAQLVRIGPQVVPAPVDRQVWGYARVLLGSAVSDAPATAEEQPVPGIRAARVESSS